MYHIRRKQYSQNFLRSRKLVTYLLGKSSIGKNDLVLEIGPGKGILTEQLLSNSRAVIGVEIDSKWYKYLKNKFKNNENLTLHHKDFLEFRLPKTSYKVFANVPFSIEGKIIRKLLESENPPDDCYLVVMKEPAYRWTAQSQENMFSIMHKPWFEFAVLHHFRRTDFIPVPRVDAVLLRIKKRNSLSIAWHKQKRFQVFVQRGYGQGLPVYKNLQQYYTNEQLLSAFNKLHLKKNSRPNSLKMHEWQSLYRSLD